MAAGSGPEGAGQQGPRAGGCPSPMLRCRPLRAFFRHLWEGPAIPQGLKAPGVPQMLLLLPRVLCWECVLTQSWQLMELSGRWASPEGWVAGCGALGACPSSSSVQGMRGIAPGSSGMSAYRLRVLAGCFHLQPGGAGACSGITIRQLCAALVAARAWQTVSWVNARHPSQGHGSAAVLPGNGEVTRLEGTSGRPSGRHGGGWELSGARPWGRNVGKTAAVLELGSRSGVAAVGTEQS